MRRANRGRKGVNRVPRRRHRSNNARSRRPTWVVVMRGEARPFRRDRPQVQELICGRWTHHRRAPASGYWRRERLRGPGKASRAFATWSAKFTTSAPRRLKPPNPHATRAIPTGRRRRRLCRQPNKPQRAPHEISSRRSTRKICATVTSGRTSRAVTNCIQELQRHDTRAALSTPHQPHAATDDDEHPVRPPGLSGA